MDEQLTYGHGEEALELPEDHLLAGLGGNRLKEEVCCSSRIQVLEEAVHSGLAETRELDSRYESICAAVG